MKFLRLILAMLGLGFTLLAFTGCESTSMHETPAGKNVQVQDVPEASSPQVSPVYLVPN